MSNKEVLIKVYELNPWLKAISKDKDGWFEIYVNKGEEGSETLVKYPTFEEVINNIETLEKNYSQYNMFLIDAKVLDENEQQDFIFVCEVSLN